MTLEQLQISDLRNIQSACLSFHPNFNIVIGANGSGKTSFIEALYLLGNGCSFKTNDIRTLIGSQCHSLTVFARAADLQRFSIQKSLHCPTKAQVNGETCLRRSELALLLPSQVFYQDIFQLIDAGPALRRGLMDWGLFHVKPSFHPIWKDYRRVLKQRNSLLRQKISLSQMLPWNRMLAELACQMDKLRSDYFVRLNSEFQKIIVELSDLQCSLDYYKGWDKKEEGKELEEILYDTHQSDSLRQYTHYGAHHADFSINNSDLRAKAHFSRGQQKITLFALKFAQARLAANACLFLIDDLAAELDHEHVKRVINYLSTCNNQVFITAQTRDAPLFEFSDDAASCYLVDQGNFTRQH